MNRAIFSATLSAVALVGAGAAAAVQSDLLGTRFQEELREDIPLSAGGAEQGLPLVRNGDAEAFALEAAQQAAAKVRGIRGNERVTRFMSEEELEAAAESLAMTEIGIVDAESAVAVSERLVGFSPEREFAPTEGALSEVSFAESANAVAQTPVPAAFGLMLGALGLGGLVLNKRRKVRQAP